MAKVNLRESKKNFYIFQIYENLFGHIRNFSQSQVK